MPAAFEKLANDIFSPVDAGGAPRRVSNSDTQIWGSTVERLLSASSAAGTWYATRALMNADLAHDAGTLGIVYADPNPALNGMYVKQGASGSGSWTQISNQLPTGAAVVAVTVTGGGPNALTASFNPNTQFSPGQAIYILRGIAADNTGPVTINGKSYRTNLGSDFAAGGIKAGGVYLFVDNGPEYRTLTDQDIAALVAQAEDAANTAVDALNSIEGLLGGVTPVFATKALAEAYEPDAAPAFLQLVGQGAAGDSGAALYRANGTSTGDIVITLSDGVTQAGYDVVDSSVPRRFRTIAEAEAANLASPIEITVDGNEPGSVTLFSDAGTVDPSEPGQIEISVAGVTHFYTRSNKILRPQQFGANVGGDGADNLAALAEMFALADAEQRVVDMGDRRDIYDISDTLTLSLNNDLVVRGDGASIRLNRGGGAPVTYGVRIITGTSLDLEGFGVDGNFETPNPFWIESTASSLVEGSTFRMVGVTAEHGYRQATGDFGGRNLSVRGWFEHLLMDDVTSGEIKMASGAVNPGVAGVLGIFVGIDGTNRYPVYKEFKNLKIGKVWCEDAANLVDMDGMFVSDPLPNGDSSRLPGTLNIYGGHYKDCHGRFMKIRSENCDIVAPAFTLTSAPTGGQINQVIDFQMGSGKLRGGSLYCNGATPKYVVNSFARTYAAGNTRMEGFSVSGSGTVPVIEALLYRFAEASHLPGSAYVIGNSTEWAQAKYTAIMRNLAGNGQVVVKDNNERYKPTDGACLRLEGSGSNAIRAGVFDNNYAGAGTRPVYELSSAVGTSVRGNTANVNPGYSVVT